MAQELAGLALRGGQRQEALDHLRPIIKTMPDRPEELWRLADMLITAGETAEARRVMQRLGSRGSTAAVASLQARLAMQRQAFGEARRILEKARPAALHAPALNRPLHCLLAHGHDPPGNPDHSLLASLP